MFGYIGKMLFVNLSDRTTEVRTFDEKFARLYLGGCGFGAKILYDEMPAHTDVFAPESIVGFIAGTLSGSSAFFGGRYTVVSKSPVTGMWNDANSGGTFGPALRKSGYDAVFIQGIAEEPVYLFIDNGKVEIRDAKHLWGKKTTEVEELLTEEIGDKKLGIALIGPAGEHLSYMAAIMNDGHRAAGRGGPGAVLGSKKLKAVVVRGNHAVEVADKKRLIEVNRSIAQDLISGSKQSVRETFGLYGTANSASRNAMQGDASIKNWKSTPEETFPEERLTRNIASTFEKNYVPKKYNCAACPLGCGSTYQLNETQEKRFGDKVVGRPEYETLCGFGSNILNDNSELIIYLNHLCNEYGFDTISFSATIAWAMECYHEGILSKEDLDGIDLTWGNQEAIEALAHSICSGEGNACRLLQNATQYAAEQIHNGYEFLSTAGGIEIAYHDPRLSPPFYATYLGDPTPGRHMRSGLGTPYKAKPAEERYNARMIGYPEAVAKMAIEAFFAAGFCSFASMAASTETHWELINSVTGFDYTPTEQYLTALRIYHQRNAFNVREGWVRSDNKMSNRLRNIPAFTSGPKAGAVIDPDRYVDSLYDVLGLDVNGKPYKEMLMFIGGLENVIRDLYGK